MPETDQAGPGPRPGLLADLARRFHLKPPQLRWLAYLAVLGLIGAWLLQFDRALTRSKPEPPGATKVSAPVPAAGARTDLERQEEELARRLEGVLSTVAGAGRVRATVTLAAGTAQVPALETRNATRTTQEQATDGGRRTITDQDQNVRPVLAGSQGWVLRQEGPRVAGVLIVAEGARYAAVREQLARAAGGALGIALNRITVAPMAGAGGGE